MKPFQREKLRLKPVRIDRNAIAFLAEYDGIKTIVGVETAFATSLAREGYDLWEEMADLFEDKFRSSNGNLKPSQCFLKKKPSGEIELVENEPWEELPEYKVYFHKLTNGELSYGVYLGDQVLYYHRGVEKHKVARIEEYLEAAFDIDPSPKERLIRVLDRAKVILDESKEEDRASYRIVTGLGRVDVGMNLNSGRKDALRLIDDAKECLLAKLSERNF